MAVNVKARRKRLLVLADWLENDVAKRIDGATFDMYMVGSADSPVPKDVETTSSCGFAGCAMGWAYYCPQLVKAGFRNIVYRDPTNTRYLALRDYNEVADFFGVTRDAAMRCFEPEEYEDVNKALTGVEGTHTVAARLREIAVAAAE